MADKLYIHPITMTAVYVDNLPRRDISLALSPNPDTIGPFATKEEAVAWAAGRNLEIVEHTVVAA